MLSVDDTFPLLGAFLTGYSVYQRLGFRSAGRALGEPGSATRRWTLATALLLGLWLTLTGSIAHTGVLRNFATLPPPIVLLIAPTFLGTLLLAFSAWGHGWHRG